MSMKIPSKRILFFFTATLLVVLLSGCGVAMRVGGEEAAVAVETVTLTRGPLTVMIGATGSVRSAQTATLSWQASGTVGDVSAAMQQAVAKGDTLASLDLTSLSQGILQAQVDLINAQNALADLTEPDPLEIALAQDALDQAQTRLDDLLNPSAVALAQAEVAVLDAQDALVDAQRNVDKLSYGRGSQEQIELARANYLLAQQNAERLQEIYEGTPGHHDEDPAKAQALSNLAGAESARDRALGTLNWYLGSPSEAEVAQAQANLTLAEANLADAQNTLAELQNPTETALALARARVTDAQETLDKLIAGPTADDLTIAQTRVTQAEAALAQARLVAPFDGTITQVMVLPGDLVSPGSPAFRIDDLSTLYVDLDVSEIDIHLVQVGQPVSITFDAILDRTYRGEITQIGQVGTANQGAVSFSVTVRMLDPDSQVRSGMTAIANIVVAQAEDILQLPNNVIQEDDNGKHYVFLPSAGGAAGEMRQVYIQVGLTSDTASEVISSELKEGDEVLVNPPGFYMMMEGGGQP